MVLHYRGSYAGHLAGAKSKDVLVFLQKTDEGLTLWVGHTAPKLYRALWPPLFQLYMLDFVFNVWPTSRKFDGDGMNYQGLRTRRGKISLCPLCCCEWYCDIPLPGSFDEGLYTK